MKQILNGIVIVAVTLCIGCLGMPTNLETPIGYLRFENSTEANLSTNEDDNLINTNKIKTQLNELSKLSTTQESPMIQIKVLEIPKNEKTTDKSQLKAEQISKPMTNKSNEKEINKTEEDNKFKDSPKDVTAEEITKQSEARKDFEDDFSLLQARMPNLTVKSLADHTNDKESHKKEEDTKFKDYPKDVTAEEITKQSEVWRDFEDDFSLLQDRMPDLTEEEFIELNKEDAIPWNFLKSLDLKRDINDHKRRDMPMQTPIYITVPIVINTQSTLPISVTIGGQRVPLTLTDDTSGPAVPTPNIKEVNVVSQVTPTSSYNKIMDYAEPPPRQTNRHRSNIRSKIYARNNNHQVQEFEYTKNS